MSHSSVTGYFTIYKTIQSLFVQLGKVLSTEGILLTFKLEAFWYLLLDGMDRLHTFPDATERSWKPGRDWAGRPMSLKSISHK